MRTFFHVSTLMVAAAMLLTGCGGGGGGGDTTSSTSTSTGSASKATVVKGMVIGGINGGGSVTPATQDATVGGTASVTLTPDQGNFINSVRGYGCSGTLNGNIFSIDKIYGKCAVIAEFGSAETTKYNVALSASPAAAAPLLAGGGIYSYDSMAYVYAGFSAEYDFLNWTENGAVVSTQKGLTFTPSADRNLVANYVPAPTYTITASAGANGSITPNGKMVVADGRSTIFTITPNAGYLIDNLVDTCVHSSIGNFISALYPNTFYASTKQQDCSIDVTFKAAATVQSDVISGPSSGSISASQLVTVGSKSEFTIYPAAGYYPYYVTGCNGTLNGNTYTTEAVDRDCYINAYYTTTPHTLFNIGVSVSSAGGGVVGGGGAYGYDEPFNQVALYAYPASGYAFKNWTELGQVVSDNPIYRFFATSHRNLVANFEPVSNVPVYDVVVLPQYGSLAGFYPMFSQLYDPWGQGLNLPVVPDPGYTVDMMYGCNGTLDLTYQLYRIPPLTSDCMIFGWFVPL